MSALIAWLDGTGAEERRRAAYLREYREFDAGVRSRLLSSLERDLGDDDALVTPILRTAARALMAEPSDVGFRIAEPMLREAAVASSFGRRRALQLLLALEEALADAVDGEREVPDRRFVALCESLVAYDELWDAGELALAGFRHLGGQPAAPSVLWVELGENSAPPFPFLVAGFVPNEPYSSSELSATFARSMASIPPGACTYFHQHGGHASHHVELVGYGVAIPHDGAARSAEKIEAHELRRWDAVLRTILRSAAGAPISCLRGLPIVRPIPGAPWRTSLELTGADQVTLIGAYGDEHERALAEVGSYFGLTPMVSLFWGNSD